MAIQLNSQFTQFVQFAQRQMDAGNAKAIARDSGGEASLGGHTIMAATGDKVAPLFGRSLANKLANNAARKLFRDTIVSIFGSMEAIPQDVKAAMKLDDYEQGKPLTARRILAVSSAIDSIARPHAEFNENVRVVISGGKKDRLPEEIKAGLAGLVDEMRTVFGDKAVPPGAVFDDIVNGSRLMEEIGGLCRTATSQLRHVTADEVVNLFRGKMLDRLAFEAVGAPVLAAVKVQSPGIMFTALSMGAQFDKRHPGLVSEIRSCKNPMEIAAALNRHEEEMNAFAGIVARADVASKSVETKAAEKIAAALGLSPRFVAAHVPTGGLWEAASDLASDIAQGKASGSMEPGYDVEAAFGALVDEFVQKRIGACAEIDSLDIPQDVKNRLKADIIGLNSLPKFTPAQLLEVAKSVDVGKIVAALDKGLPMKLAVEMLNNVVKEIGSAVGRATGDPQFIATLGADDLASLYGMLVTIAEAKNPKLAPAIQNVRNAFLVPAGTYCEKQSLGYAASFIRALAAKGETTKAPITNEARFLALVESDVAAALSADGVTDAKVCADVKDAMRKRARAALAEATELKSLDAFIATVKTEAVDLARDSEKRAAQALAKYAAGLSQETVPILKKLVNALDWRGEAAERSEEIVKNYAEDMKTWRDIAPGSPDAAGLEAVFTRRMNDYLKDVLAGNANATFNTGAHPGLLQTFLEDLPRNGYVINGKKVEGKTLAERLPVYMGAIKDPEKRKVVSVMVNQQIFGDYTTSVANRVPFSGWKNGMADEDVAGIPGIEKFASRDIQKTGYQLFDTGPMAFEIDVSPDESTVKVRAKSEYPLHGDISMPTTIVGRCTVTQEFVIDFTGGEPTIRDLKIGQTLSA